MQRAEAIACLRRLEALAPYRYNVALGETMQLLWDGWLDADGVALWLERLRDGDPSGDIYAVRAAGGR
jgi:hypothetical protein